MKGEKEMITFNLKLLRECLLATEKKPYGGEEFESVYIEDDETRRHYVATNGLILIHASEEREVDNEKLEEPLLIKPQIKFKKEIQGEAIFIRIDKESGILRSFANFPVDIIDRQYPDWRRVIPTDIVLMDYYRFFNWKYIKIVQDVAKEHLSTPWVSKNSKEERPQPIIFKFNKDNVDYEIVVMPMTI